MLGKTGTGAGAGRTLHASPEHAPFLVLHTHVNSFMLRWGQLLYVWTPPLPLLTLVVAAPPITSSRLALTRTRTVSVVNRSLRGLWWSFMAGSPSGWPA